MKLSNMRTGWITTVNQTFYQQSDWASNRPQAHRSHPVCKTIRYYVVLYYFAVKLKHEKPIICNKKESVIGIQP